ncbi:MAG: hypothetical protein AAFY35_07245 [Pseudomonadota bacterium]
MRGFAQPYMAKGHRRIGVILPGNNPLELFFAVRDGLPHHDYFVFAPGLSEDNKARLNGLGVRHTHELGTFLMLSDSLECALSFGLLAHDAHLQPLIAASLLREMSIPIIDIQHGLFQWGINFSDSSLQQGFSKGEGVSLPFSTEADVQLTWNGINPIGYPRMHATRPRRVGAPGSHVITIATNTNWHIYSAEEQIRLREILRQLFLDLPHQTFAFKPHPAETSAKKSLLFDLVAEVSSDRKKFVNVQVLPSMSEGGQSLTDVIKNSDAGIVTAGTSIMDFELFGIPCVAFECRSTSKLLGALTHVETFSNYDELLAFLCRPDRASCVPETGHLRAFDPDALQQTIEEQCDGAQKADQQNKLKSRLEHMMIARQLGQV